LSFRRHAVLIALAVTAAACAHSPRRSPQTEPQPAVAAPVDPTVQRIADADAHLARGLEEVKNGHLTQAREQFDQAVDLYLTAPGGAFANAALGEAYRRTLETIYLQELESLAAGDAFTEAPLEPASIDALEELAIGEERPTEETRKTAEAAVREEANDLPIELNDRVLRCIDLYQGNLREWFAEALARGGRYLPHIREVFASEGIPQDLAYVALVESAFKTAALSRARAKGVWQFMAATGKQFGLKQDWWVDERSNPEKATRAAARYLKQLHDLFGDWNLALASYNAGPGKLLRAIRRYGTNNFWSLTRTRGLRRETKNYVPMIHAAIVVAKAPEKYGFEVTEEAPLAFENAPVESAVDLRTVAECLSAPIDEIRALNPELRRLATPARSYDLRVPPGTAETLTTCLQNLPPEKRVRFRTHVVARGQTLSRIARAHGVRTRDIADANGLALNKRLRPGTELIIPVPVRARTTVTRTARKQTVPTAPPDGSMRVRHRIRAGDTLSTLASQYGTTVKAIRSWNGLRTTRIAVGATLTIYTNRSANVSSQ
jgi:membrane-bound lytic murein transglycosylase D